MVCGAHLAGVVAHRAGRHRGGARFGRFAPQLLNVATWPYILLARLRLSRGRAVDRRRTTPARVGACAANRRPVPLRFRTVGLFTVGGVALAVMTVVLDRSI